MSHRKPPLPAHYGTPRKGFCRWCAEPVLNGKGEATTGTWHPACVVAFKLIHWPAVTRAAVFERDKGICARCGVDADLQRRADRETARLWYWLARRHFDERVVRGELKVSAWGECYTLANREVEKQQNESGRTARGPAWEHDHIRPLVEAKGDLSFWALDNIQTLCRACHVQKGKEDNARRRAARQQPPAQPQGVLPL